MAAIDPERRKTMIGPVSRLYANLLGRQPTMLEFERHLRAGDRITTIEAELRGRPEFVEKPILKDIGAVSVHETVPHIHAGLPKHNLPLAPRLVVAVRTWNAIQHKRLDLLDRTLASLVGSDVVLVDNGSTDGTAEKVLSMASQVIECCVFKDLSSGLRLAGRGQNLAIAVALAHRPDLVVFSDDDVEWKPGWREKLISYWHKVPDDVGIISGLYEPLWSWNAVEGLFAEGAFRASVPGASWSFPTAYWKYIGPVPEGMDHDLSTCRRLRKLDIRMAALDLCTHTGRGRSTHGNRPQGDW